jgi:hypothetical protein
MGGSVGLWVLDLRKETHTLNKRWTKNWNKWRKIFLPVQRDKNVDQVCLSVNGSFTLYIEQKNFKYLYIIFFRGRHERITSLKTIELYKTRSPGIVSQLHEH